MLSILYSAVSFDHMDISLSAVSAWRICRAIAFGYYDGPTEGLIDLGENTGAFSFITLAIDNEREQRVIRLSRITEWAFDEIVGLLANHCGQPRWPWWVPVWNFGEEVSSRLANDIDRICKERKGSFIALCDEGISQFIGVSSAHRAGAREGADWFEIFRGEST